MENEISLDMEEFTQILRSTTCIASGTEYLSGDFFFLSLI